MRTFWNRRFRRGATGVAIGVAALLTTSLAVLLAAALGAYPIERVTVAADGTESDGSSAGSSILGISPDGRFVTFESAGTNLVPGDTNSAGDAFIYDRIAKTPERVSVSGAGVAGNNASFAPFPSGDGNLVVFGSLASNLVAGDTNGVSDVFLRDRAAHTTTRISMGVGGAEPNGFSRSGPITPDGGFILFSSEASNLVAGDTNGQEDVFVLDRGSGAIERVSLSSAGVQADGSSEAGSISPDGRYVVFVSDAANLVSGDENGDYDVFRYDRLTDTVALVSATPGGRSGDGASFWPGVSADGRYVAFWSEAPDLVAGDTNDFRDVFVRDVVSGTTERVSVSATAEQGSGNSYSGGFSSDGRFVVFESDAANLVPGDTNGHRDVFVYDRTTKQVERISVSVAGSEGDEDSDSPVVSADGRYVAFRSWTTNLVSADTNGVGDVFVVDRGPQAPPAPAFTDIAGSPYRTAIEDLAGAGIIGGYQVNGSWEFRPQNPLWRAQFAKMIVGSWGFSVTEEQTYAPFTDLGTDVLDNLYPHEYVGVAYQKGITKGVTATTFGPYVDITRAQLITMVVRSVQAESPGTLSSPPAGWTGTLPSSDPTHGANIRLAEYNGLLDGITLTGWDIWGKANRGETAQILHNMRGM